MPRLLALAILFLELQDEADDTDLDLLDGLFDRTALAASRSDYAAMLIHQTQGRIFGATVRKRDNSFREFNAKLYPDSFSPANQARGQVVVQDVSAKPAQFRTIALEGVKSLRIDGVVYDLDALFGPLVVDRSKTTR